MDEEEMDERFQKLGFRPQKEYVYNKLLPYADKLDEESTELFIDIKTNLIKSVLAREIRPGCALWTSRLNKYMKIYGLKFSKEDHIALIKLFYELLTIPNLEPTRVNKFASTLSHLLKKRYLLSQDDLQLEWRPLYELCDRVMEKSNPDIGMYKYFSTLEGTIENLIRYARVYFPASATQEILDEFRPLLCPFVSSEMARGIEYLELFLPICIRPQQASVSYELWFEEFMKLWEICNNATVWENHMMWLMARLSVYNVGYINWEPYVPIMFVRFLRTLSLPVAYRKKQSGKQFKLDISAIATWIACAIGGESETTFVHLEKFMQTLESYYHPANSGSWSPKIRELLKKLSFYFVQRVHCERHKRRSWETPIPDHFKLTDADITRFVTIMKPCVEQAMFSRQGSQDVRLAMQYLASLRPEIIVPVALEKLYASMDSLTEPHRLTSSMMGVLSVARYMVQGAKYHYPEGPTHVIPLLNGLLPGIDPNDIRKCFMTFNFIVQFINMCPIVNSSEASKYYDDLTEEEHIVCEASAGFEDFVLQFFDRLCAWVESNSLEFTRLEQLTDDSNRKSRAESMTENAIMSVIHAVLGQCSPQIFSCALKKVHKFATERILEVKISGKMIAVICQCFAKINAKETLKLFVPQLCDTIERLMGEHENVLEEEHLDDELLYNMLLLSDIVDGQSELLDYTDRLYKILDLTLHMTSLKGSQIAAHMLKLMLSSLTFTQPTEYRSCSKGFDLHVKDFLTIREWGNPGNIKDLNLTWYVPGEKEIGCAQELLNRYLVPEIQKLENHSDGLANLPRDDLTRSLRIVISIMASQTVLPIWDEPALQLVESKLQPWAFQLIVNSEYLMQMPDGRNVRKVIADTLHKLQRKIQDVDEGDTKNVQYIIHIYDILLFNKFRGRDFQFHWKNFHVLKKMLEDRVHQNKQHLRHLLIDRVMLHQEFRNESRSCSFTETHRQILLDLFELGVSRYSLVRILAQEKLFAAVSYFPYSYTVITPRLKHILGINSTENHEQFKGCLYILLGPKSTPIIARHDWTFIRDMWPALVTSMPSEKPSIVYLVNAIADAIHRYFPTIAIKLEIPDKCIEAAYAWARTSNLSFDDFGDVIQGSVKALELKGVEKEEAYSETVDRLVEACETKNLHWLYHSVALSCIRDLVHEDVKYSARTVKFFLQALVSDSLAVRKIAVKVMLYISIQNKPKFKKVTIDPFRFSRSLESNEKLVPGNRTDNEWLLYDSETVPKDAASWDELRYVHNQYSGFYTWPKELKVYAPPSEQDTPSKRMDNLTDREQEIYDFFNNKSNVDLLIKYLSMEEKKGRDKFSSLRFLMFKNIFKTFEDALLPNFIPHLTVLVADKQEQSQRCAAEILSGLIKGSKHWSFEQAENMWTAVLPILRTAILNMSDETLADWGLCVGLSLDTRDPNRYYRLLEFLMTNPLEEQSSFLASGRLYLLQNALNQQPWRNAELSRRLLKYLEGHLSHPFQNIRDKISTCLTTIFCKDIVFPGGNPTRCPRVSDFFESVIPKLDTLYNESLKKLSASNDEEMPSSSNNHKHRNSQVLSLDSTKEQDSICLFKIVANYVTISIVKVNFSAVPEYFQLLPLACVLQSNDTDDELGAVCSNLLAILAHSMILPEYIPQTIEAIKTIANCPFWSARVVIAEFIPVLIFHNMATIVSNEDWVLEIQKIVLQLLEDMQPEVRTKASNFLSGLLHCEFILAPQQLLSHFKQKAKTKLKRRDMSQSSNSTLTNNSAMRYRHAGVLGLCAFINSHPYDVPEFLPDVFGQLGPHLSDPQPIPSTIRKTLEDFKRTHHDNWQVHKLKFTEEELSILSDLTVPPSYYV